MYKAQLVLINWSSEEIMEWNLYKPTYCECSLFFIYKYMYAYKYFFIIPLQDVYFDFKDAVAR